MSTPKDNGGKSLGRKTKAKRVVRKLWKKLPARVRKNVKSVAKKVLPARVLPKRQTINQKNPAKTAVLRKFPLDPLELAVQPSSNHTIGRQRPVAGRAAAGTELDPDASARLSRAMFGTVRPARTSRGGRPVAGIFAPDLERSLAAAGHDTISFVPGISRAHADHAEVLVIDLAGFHGVWEGALDPAGVGLMREVTGAIAAARGRGVTCWLVVRGDQLHHHGSILLQGSPLLESIVPGLESSEQTHFTENPGDVPAGIVQIIRSLEVAE